MIGFCYPAYMTLQALESGTPDDKSTWLMYWGMYNGVTLFDEYLPFVVYWIPFYYPVKASFLLYCMWPNMSGTKHVYNGIKGLFQNVNDKVDEALKNASEKTE